MINRNVAFLSLCQALFSTGNLLVMTVASIVGNMMASPDLATLPIALQFMATALITIPASYLMKRWGRKPVFLLGAFSGALGGGVCFTGIHLDSFLLFCLGSLLIGNMAGIAIYYRFAAVDGVPEKERGRAISLVLAGSILAAFIGPELAKWSKELVEGELFAGTYAVIATLPLIAFLVLLNIKIAPLTKEEFSEKSRSFGQIIRQKTVLVAIIGAAIAQSVMALLMVATPLAMQICDLEFHNVAFVIQWHVLGMYTPSLFTGRVINRLGVLNTMILGGIAVVLCISINLLGTSLYHFWWALFLLGIGWNFLFVGATTLLTSAYRAVERAKIQAVNEFVVFATVTIAALSSGILLNHFGWRTINLFSFVPIAMIMGAIILLKISPQNPKENLAFR